MEDRCKINRNCTSWHNGVGEARCLKCDEMQKTVSQGNHYHRGLLTDSEMIEDVTDNNKLTSIFHCLVHIEHHDRQIFEDYQFGNVSMNELARQHNTNRQAIYRTIRSVRHDIKKMLSLSTVF